jgi:hypothetical protein
VSSSLVFLRGGIRFAVPLEDVRRICATGEVQQLLAPAQDVEGVVADGSHIVPVIASPLPSLEGAGGRVRVVLLNNGESPFGIRVETVDGPRDLDGIVPSPLNGGLLEALREVPAEAVLGMVSIGAAKPLVPGAASLEPIVMLSPGPLYRARALPEDG